MEHVQRSYPRMERKKKTHFLMTEHIFLIFIQSPHFNHSYYPLLNVLIYYIFSFTIWGQIGHLKNAWTWLRSSVLVENAFLMLQHERKRAWWCHCGLKEMPFFLWPAILLLIWGHLIWSFSLEGDRNTVTHGSLLSLAAEFKVTGTHGPQGGWV